MKMKRAQLLTFVLLVVASIVIILLLSYHQEKKQLKKRSKDDNQQYQTDQEKDKTDVQKGKQVITAGGNVISQKNWQKLLQNEDIYYYHHEQNKRIKQKYRWIELVFFRKRNHQELKPYPFESFTYKKQHVEQDKPCGTSGAVTGFREKAFRVRFSLSCDQEGGNLGFNRTYRILGIGSQRVNIEFTTPSKEDLSIGQVKTIPVMVPQTHTDQQRTTEEQLIVKSIPMSRVQKSGEGTEAAIRVLYVYEDEMVLLNETGDNTFVAEEKVKNGGSIFIYRVVFEPPEHPENYDFPDGVLEYRKLMYVISNVKTHNVDFHDADTNSLIEGSVSEKIDIRSHLSEENRTRDHMNVSLMKSFSTGSKTKKLMPVYVAYLWKEDDLHSVMMDAVPSLYRLQIDFKREGEMVEKIISNNFTYPPDN